MSQRVNPYESPRGIEEEIEVDARPPASEATLKPLVDEARRTEPWLLLLAILTGFPAGGIATASLAAFGVAGCLAIVPTVLALTLMLAAVRMRYAAKALGRKAVEEHAVDFVNSASFLLLGLAPLLLIVVVLEALALFAALIYG